MSVKTDATKRAGFLARIRHDQNGNVAAMMAAGLIPLTAMIGSGVDVSRIYLTQTRLQQACDAGALAGRKKMGVNTWAFNSFTARTAANNMFDANFRSGTSGSTNLSRVYTESGGTVTGTASVELPMAIMQMFGKGDHDISVTCEAELAIPNTDVMFVLDTTGSMNQAEDGTNNQTAVELSNSKIVGLRQAVRCFYEALSKQNSAADCGSTPSGATQTAQIRFGFVPYAVNVNVGRLLPTNYFADNWTYQSRVPVLSPVWAYTLGSESPPTFGDYNNPSTPTTPTSWTSYTTNNTSQTRNINGTNYQTVYSEASCPRTGPGAYTEVGTAYDELESTSSAAPVHPAASVVYGNYTRTLPQTRWMFRYAVSNNRCRLQYGSRSFDKTASGTSNKPVSWTNYPNTISNWQYRAVTHDIASLKNGSGWNNSVALPVGYNTQNLLVSGSTTLTSYKQAVNATVIWDGCVEERQTTRAITYYPIPAAAKDLDVDLIPTADTTTRWAPILPDAVWGRYTGSSTETTSTVSTINELNRNFSYSCPEAASRLTSYPTSTAFDAYVSGLTAEGNTYHDIGLIWGARLISPTGLFAADNDNRSNIQRHVVFMTDGDTVTNTQGYGAYGVEWWDRRRTATGSAPTTGLLDQQVNNRFRAMCSYMKNEMGVTLWVVAFGAGVSGTAQTNLQACASPGKYYSASNSAALISTFQGIAAEISDLRLTS
jgi:Flp pilus assembly protein TadG